MSSEWPYVNIREVAEVFDGPHATPEKTASGPVFLGINTLKNGRLDLSDTAHLSEEDFKKWTRRVRPKKGDIVFSYETRIGEAAIIPEGLRCCLGRRMGLVRAIEDKLHPRFFLYQYLSHEYQEFLKARTVHGSTVNRLAIKEFPDFPIRLPPLPEQRAIAHILGTLDDKIENNRRMNATLEAMAQALFKSWFVDFDPVRAKAEGREPEGMDAATAALFPDRLVDSELGEVPEGWDIKHVSECCDLARGASPRPIQEFMGNDVPWIKIADATAANGPFIFDTKEKIIKEGVSKSVLLTPGSLILSNSATCGLPFYLELEGCIHDGWLYFTNYRNISDGFLFHTLRHISANLVHIADGSVQKNLNTKLVGSQKLVVPTNKIMSIFQEKNSLIFKKIKQDSIESRSLSHLRDTLLPKLISGELRVPEATKITEAAL